MICVAQLCCKSLTHVLQTSSFCQTHVLVASNSISLLCLEGRIYIIGLLNPLPVLIILLNPLPVLVTYVQDWTQLQIFANFTIFRFGFKFNKFCDFSLNSTRYTKIRCLDDFSARCAKIYNFILIDQQAPACRFYKIYKIYDFSLTSRFFNKPLRNLRFFALLCNANSTY